MNYCPAICMRLVLISICVAVGGCTTTAVNNTGEDHASNMIELQYQQVVDNLARFVWDENSLPSHVTLTQGIAQVSDRLAGGFNLPFTTEGSAQRQFNIAGERQWTVNWSVRPVVEGDSLMALQSLYRDAVRRSIRP